MNDSFFVSGMEGDTRGETESQSGGKWRDLRVEILSGYERESRHAEVE